MTDLVELIDTNHLKAHDYVLTKLVCDFIQVNANEILLLAIQKTSKKRLIISTRKSENSILDNDSKTCDDQTPFTC